MRLENPIETEHLRLANLSESDAGHPYVTWMNDGEVMQYLEARFSSFNENDLVSYIKEMNASSDNLLLGMFLKSEERHIGNIKLGPLNPHHKRADIGLLIGERAQWGRGYATEAISAVAEYALSRLSLRKLQAGAYSSNIGSIRAFLKAGFEKEALLKSHWKIDDGWLDEVLLARFAV